MRWDQQVRWQVCSAVNVKFHFHKSKFLKSCLVSGSRIASKRTSFVVAEPGGDVGLVEKGVVIPAPRLPGDGTRRGRGEGASREFGGGGAECSESGKIGLFAPPPCRRRRGYRQGCYPGEPPAPLKTHFSRPAYPALPVAVSSGISSQPDRSGTGFKAALVVPECCARAGFLLRPRNVS